MRDRLGKPSFAPPHPVETKVKNMLWLPYALSHWGPNPPLTKDEFIYYTYVLVPMAGKMFSGENPDKLLSVYSNVFSV